MWTLVIFHKSNECEDRDYSSGGCQSEVDLYECETSEEIQKELADLTYNDKYRDDGTYYWYLFQGKDLNSHSSWKPEDTGGLDLHAIVEKAEEDADARNEEVQRRLKEKQEAERQRKEEMERRSEERKIQLLERSEKTRLDDLLRKYGLPDWIKEIPHD